MKNLFCYQLYDGDCGFACLKMLLGNINDDISYLYLINPKEKGNYSFIELSNIALKYNVILKGYECYNLDLIKPPVIALVDGVNNNHYVLVTRITKKRIYYNDPNFGRLSVRKKQFLKGYKGKYLLPFKYIKTKCLKRVNRVVFLLPVMLLSLCELIFLVTNCIFINNTLFYFISILCVFIIQFISNIITRIYTINYLNKLCKKKNLNHNQFSKISIHLSNYIATYMKMLEKIYVIANLIIVSLNNVSFINYIIIFLISFIYYFINKKLINEENKLALYEKRAFNNGSKEDYFLKVKKYLLKNDVIVVLAYFIFILYKSIELIVYKDYLSQILISSFLCFYLLNKMIDLSKYIYEFKKRNINLNALNNILEK